MKEVLTIEDRLILRQTQQQYDERFYYDETYKNRYTDGHWFPSVTYVLSYLPTSKHLIEWQSGKGFEESQRIMKRKGNIGDIVHQCIYEMIDSRKPIPQSTIDLALADPKDALHAKRSLQGFVNFFNDYKPEVLHCERTLVTDTHAGTIDLRCKINKDDYKNTYTIDYKTSRGIYTSHKIQCAAYAKGAGDPCAALLHIGNSTKKYYTLTDISDDIEHYYNIFNTVLHTFYLFNMKGKAGSKQYYCEPTIETIDETFYI